MLSNFGHIRQTFYFTSPYPTTKVRLDELDGDPEIAFKVEFLGLDRAKRNSQVDPMEGGYITTSKLESVVKYCQTWEK